MCEFYEMKETKVISRSKGQLIVEQVWSQLGLTDA